MFFLKLMRLKHHFEEILGVYSTFEIFSQFRI